MSKNVVVNGTNYNNITYVKLMQQSGALASFVDVDAVAGGRSIFRASGQISLSETVTQLSVTGLAFTPRVFWIYLDDSTRETGKQTEGCFAINDFVQFARTNNAGEFTGLFNGGTMSGSTGTVSNKLVTCTTVNDTGTTASTAYRLEDGFVINPFEGSSFPFLTGRKYNWTAFGWED